MRRIAVLSTLVLASGLLGPATALAAEDEHHGKDTDRWIAVEDHFAIVLPDGRTFTEETAPMEEELPPVGARLFISEALHDTEDGTTRGDAVGRTHIECTAQVVPVNFLCDIVYVFDTGSQLHGTVLVDFSSPSEPSEPLQFDIAVTGGTGDYFGATGAVTLTDLSDMSDPEAETVTLYEAHLELAGK
jgi:hypothetical protein